MKIFEKLMSSQAAKPILLDDELVEFVGGDGCTNSCGMSCDSTCDVTCDHTCGTTELTSNDDPIEP